jgi:hypothetical protein
MDPDEVREALPSRVEDLARRLERLESRVAELEASPRGAARTTELPDDDEDLLPVPTLPSGTLALAGRTLLVLAGAYVVRALTESHVVPAAVGVAIGLAYAAFWQLRADRDALRGRRDSAAFHDLASSLIAFPLIWESASRFGALSPPVASAALVAFFALGLGVAVHRRLVVNAALTTALALVTSVSLLVGTHDLLPAFLALLAIAAVLEWLAFHETWLGLRWAAAVVLDGVAILLITVATQPHSPPAYESLTTLGASRVLLGLPLLYVVGVAARTLRHERPATIFEIVQGALAALLGFGGASRVLTAHRLAALGPAVLATLVGALCYAAAFAFAERRPGQGRNFYFYSAAGGLLTLGGTAGLGLGPALPLVWSGLGLGAGVLGRRFDRMTLRAHSALFLVAAALPTGLVVASSHALAGLGSGALSAPAWGVAAAAAVAWAVLTSDSRAPRGGLARLPQLLLAVLVVLAAGKAVHLVLTLALGSLAGDEGVAAVARTAVLGALVLVLAWSARRGAFPELAWLVYPLLAVGGLKLLLQDLPHGRPATLVASLAVYGAVLIAAPRLMRPPEPDRS